MTDDMIILRSLLENSHDTDLMREMIGCAAKRLRTLIPREKLFELGSQVETVE